MSGKQFRKKISTGVKLPKLTRHTKQASKRVSKKLATGKTRSKKQ